MNKETLEQMAENRKIRIHEPGHACHAVTGAFLTTEVARSNIISHITGAWGKSGFHGLKGKFKRKGLLSFGHSGLQPDEVRFHRISTHKSVVVRFDSRGVLSELRSLLDFDPPFRFCDSI